MQPAVCRGLSWLQLVLSDFSHSSINKDQFQRKKNDTLDPELYVALLNSFESHYCVKGSRGIKRVISSGVMFSLYYLLNVCLLSPRALSPLRLVECIDCGRKMHQICVLHNETIWPSGWASYHRHTREHTRSLRDWVWNIISILFFLFFKLKSLNMPNYKCWVWHSLFQLLLI